MVPQEGIENHMAALDQLIETSLNFIDNSKPDFQIPLSEYYERVISLKEEDERNIESLQENIKALDTTHKSIQHQIKLLKEKVEHLKKEKQNLQEYKGQNQKKLARVKKEHDSKRKEVLEIKRQLSKDCENQNTLNRNKNELLLYKQITGISWDFGAPHVLLKGYVTNKETGYLKPFCFNKEKMSSSQITGDLWEMILESSSEQD